MKNARGQDTLWERVITVTRSPMNRRQWLLVLECGHGAFVTRKTKPKLSKVLCWKCADLRKP